MAKLFAVVVPLMPKPAPVDLTRRESQIMEILYRRRRATVEDIRAELPDAPSPSSVRKLLEIMIDRGLLAREYDGPRYVYFPAAKPEDASRSALKQLVRTFFNDSPGSAMAALLDIRVDAAVGRRIPAIERAAEAGARTGRRAMSTFSLTAPLRRALDRSSRPRCSSVPPRSSRRSCAAGSRPRRATSCGPSRSRASCSFRWRRWPSRSGRSRFERDSVAVPVARVVDAPAIPEAALSASTTDRSPPAAHGINRDASRGAVVRQPRVDRRWLVRSIWRWPPSFCCVCWPQRWRVSRFARSCHAGDGRRRGCVCSRACAASVGVAAARAPAAQPRARPCRSRSARRRPAIVIPAIADAWTEDRRRAVLLHELAHVAR